MRIISKYRISHSLSRLFYCTLPDSINYPRKNTALCQYRAQQSDKAFYTNFSPITIKHRLKTHTREYTRTGGKKESTARSERTNEDRTRRRREGKDRQNGQFAINHLVRVSARWRERRLFLIGSP